MEKHVPNLLSAFWALGFFVLLLAFSKLVRPSRRDQPSRGGFNSGETTNEKPWIRMSARHHVLIVAAVLFFLGALLLYPAMAMFRQWLEDGHGIAALLGVGIFMSTLSVALAYSWMKGDLSWIRDAERVLTESSHNKEEHGDSGERIS